MNGQRHSENGQNRLTTEDLLETRQDRDSEVKGSAPLPPDGGWGWVVTFSSFMVGLVVDGICFTFGFFFLEFQTYFNANKSVTSLINSVLNGTYLTIGNILYFLQPTTWVILYKYGLSVGRYRPAKK